MSLRFFRSTEVGARAPGGAATPRPRPASPAASRDELRSAVRMAARAALAAAALVSPLLRTASCGDGRVAQASASSAGGGGPDG
ncbi:MAG: hypothetical protein WKG00_29665, partial [Polyangiaceae bacterium]